ncbi:anti-CBASS protein Acb1 family protein [Lacrimispora sp.]|uniref:anti-CBASS protein Acb1 family protein n=1 Tax=Lacrimispora sp. TaxID=2719234 RepID=UPI0028AD6694|nr:anti-CBASS Acb1 family protein [Lacrimispora sp.]
MSDRKRLKEYQIKSRGKAILERRQGTYREDGYMNMLNKYGTSQDNSEAYDYMPEEFADDMELTRLYEGNGLFTKIIDRPSEEAIKHGFDIDYGDEAISEYVEDKMDELELEDRFATAEKWARLYGGSIIVMLVDDGRGLEEPLDWNNVRSIEELRVFDRSIVQPDYTSMYSNNAQEIMEKHRKRPLDQPEYYTVFSLYGYFTVHYTRCLVFRNGRLPEHTSNALYRYWGIPEYVKIKRALRETITAHSDGVKLLERSVQAIYKMKGLANLLATDEGEDKAIRRMQIIDMARGILNSLAIDSDGEDYDFKTLQMAGVKDILDSTCNMLSAVTDIPQTILFGRSPAGENSTGDSDFENYYNMVEKIQKMNMKSNGRTVIDLILIEGKESGKIEKVPKYKMKFAPLWSMSETEQATVEQTRAATEQTKAQTAQMYVDMQAVDPSEVRRVLAQGDTYDIQELVPEDEFDLPDDLMNIEGVNLVEDPGKSGIDDMVKDESAVTAAAIIVCRNGKILIGKRSDGSGLCGPGGKIEVGETLKQAAQREALEEFHIATNNLIPIGIYKGTTGKYRDTMVYLCPDLKGEPEADGNEMLSAEWKPISELLRSELFPPFRESIFMLLKEIRGDPNE